MQNSSPKARAPWKVLTFLFLSSLFTPTSSLWALTPPTAKILFLGDSLTEGLGVKKEDAYPSLLEKLVNAKGHNIAVINAGVSGSVSQSGIERFKWHTRSSPTHLFLCLGVNDGRRGVPVMVIEKNLSDILDMALAKKMKIILAGMKLPPNFGKKYVDEFESMYPRLAKKYNAIYMPFLLEGVAGEKLLNIEDAVHPNEKGHKIIAEKALPFVLESL